MKLKSLSLLFVLFLIAESCHENASITIGPQPIDTTYIKTDMEDGTYKDLKRSWLEAIHTAAPDTDWRYIEQQNFLNSYQQNIDDKPNTRSNRTVNIGQGQIIGEWVEKGSINQAGSVIKSAYNKKDDKLYAISAGGSMWKGNLSSFQWEVENEQLRFDHRFLDIVYPPQSNYRIIASIGGLPYFKNSNNPLWQPAEGITDQTIRKTKDQIIFQDGRYVAFLSQASSSQNVELFLSQDYGESYRLIRTFGISNLDQASIASSVGDNTFYLIERTSTGSSKVYSYDINGQVLNIHTSLSPIQFGNNVANLEVIKQNGLRFLFSYDRANNIFRSVDNGLSWVNLGELPTTPWDAGVFVSERNPNIMIMGAIEAYRTIDAGRTWTKTNQWYEYYSNTSTALHADIMDINEFYRNSGEHNLITTNHGGVSKSTNIGQTYSNMGLSGLNASQYYSVKTYPENPNYIFAGSQDQGIQRAYDIGSGAASFTQMISGDYGHLQFTNEGKSLWAIYPGGWISYYPDPIAGGIEAEFELLTNNQSVWLPPIMTSPYNPNSILIAGGSMIGSSGSHIVELNVDELSQLFANQWPFNFRVSGGEVSAMAYNRARPDEFFVLSTTGRFYKSTNRGRQFTEKSGGLAEAHYLYGNTILTSSIDANKILIGGSGYSNPAVFQSRDGGESFVPMTEGLPATTVFEMVYSPDEKFIFASTEAGPYVYIVNKNRWYNLADGSAPNQRYWSVEFLKGQNKVRYATYGRGIWDFEIQQLTRNTEVADIEKPLVYPNPSSGPFTVSPFDRKGQLTITDKNGQLILIKELKANQSFEFELSAFPNGLYYVIFDDGTQKSSSVIIKV